VVFAFIVLLAAMAQSAPPPPPLPLPLPPRPGYMEDVTLDQINDDCKELFNIIMSQEMSDIKSDCKVKFTGDNGANRGCVMKCFLQAAGWTANGLPNLEGFQTMMAAKTNDGNKELVQKVVSGTEKCYQDANFDTADPDDENCSAFGKYSMCMFRNGLQLCTGSKRM